MADSSDRPRLRPLEALPFEHEGEPHIAWRDPLGLMPMIQVPHPVAALMSLLDGTRTCQEVLQRWFELAEEELPAEFLEELLGQLEDHLALETPRFREALAEHRAAFSAREVRPPAHCPGGYPDDPAICASLLDDLLRRGQAEAPAQRSGAPLGLVAPHIDLTRGGVSYGAAYETLRESDADLFIVLGVAHSTTVYPDPPPLATLTRLDYDTPLGTAITDRRFIDDLLVNYQAAGGDPLDLFRDELVHETEHSIEFQMLFLEHLHGHRDVRVVPLLMGSLHEFYEQPDRLLDGATSLGPLVRALRQTIAEYPGRVCLVAGADLSHVGPRFGDPEPVDEARVEAVGEGDQEALHRFILSGADAFFAHFAADHNQRNVCSVANLYLLRALLPEAEVELLRWEAAFDPQQTVTFAAAALR